MNPQAVPSQVAVAFPGGVQGVQKVPQVAVLVFATQAEPQRWKPVLQLNPHFVPSQVAVALVGAVHAVQELAPHEAGAELDTQAVPQRWKPALQL